MEILSIWLRRCLSRYPMNARSNCQSASGFFVFTSATKRPPVVPFQLIHPGYLTCTQRPSRFLRNVVAVPRSARSLLFRSDLRLGLVPDFGTTWTIFMNPPLQDFP